MAQGDITKEIENDRRNNHFSKQNHIILAKQIFNFFVKNDLPDITEFKIGFLLSLTAFKNHVSFTNSL